VSEVGLSGKVRPSQSGGERRENILGWRPELKRRLFKKSGILDLS
jgi:hypothetical protein